MMKRMTILLIVLTLALFGSMNVVAQESSPSTIITPENAAQLQQVGTLESNADFVGRLAFQSGGSLLAAVSRDEEGSFIDLWDISTGERVRSLTSEVAWITNLAFSADGSLLADAACLALLDGSDNDCTAWGIEIWDVATGRSIATWQAHSAAVVDLAFSPDGKLLASASNDKTVGLWEVPTGAALRSLTGQTIDIRDDGVHVIYALEFMSLAFSPDGKLLAAGNSYGWVQLWDVEALRAAPETALDVEFDTVLAAPELGGVYEVTFNGDGSRVLAAHGDASVVIWNTATATLERTVRTGATFVFDLAHSSQQSVFAVGVCGTLDSSNSCVNNAVTLWDSSNGSRVAILDLENDYPSVAFSSDGTRLASAGSTLVRLWGVLDAGGETGDEVVVVPSECSLQCSRAGDGLDVLISCESGEVTTEMNNSTSVEYSADGSSGTYTMSIDETRTYSLSGNTYKILGTIIFHETAIAMTVQSYELSASGGEFGETTQTCEG